eukprot:TRINITY_DN103515_c0_g1_i1.p1 TRINITY_DN103515_c0_g1~~TRINITY_DN103515_c0_g1_i1.p1  ORF type:complete len:719 (+),score=158.58 TRINITY_DN103515_c0_g1_i1:87-2159(+)
MALTGGSAAFLAAAPTPPPLTATPSVGEPASVLGESRLGFVGEVAWSEPRTLAYVSCAAGVGLALGLAGRQRSRRRHAHHMNAAVVLRACGEQSSSGAATVQKQETVDDVESSVAEFVPKISALQNQAELLRSGELRQVIDTMRCLRKTELGGVFGEVDSLLAALIDAIHGLRDSALTIRNSELREHFEQLDVPSQASRPAEVVDRGTASSSSRGQREEPETMMEVHIVGLSHHSAPVEVRQKLAVAEADWNMYSQELVQYARTSNGYVVPEAAVISTCNRFELYFASPETKKYSAIECVHSFLRTKSGLSREEIEPYLFTYTGHAATKHLFEVSSGLDSLVLGEAQILAQVKACHSHAIAKGDEEDDAVPGSGGKIIAKMLNAGIRIGKLVRTRTKIGKGSVSVSSAAVELMMSRAMADLRKQAATLNVCVVGAGKMSRLLLLALFSKHPEIRVTLVNRSVEKAQVVLDDEMVKARGGANAEVAPMEDMFDVIKSSDVVFTATGSKEPIIYPKDLEGLGQRRLMLIDISVPLNVASGCENCEGVASYSVDDLKKVVEANAAKRQSEVDKAKIIIGNEVEKFKVWQASQGAVPYLAALQAMAENIRKQETEKMSKKLRGLHEKEREAVDKLTRHIVDSLFRPIYYSMKEEEAVAAKKEKIWALKNMFRLEPLYKRGVLTEGTPPKGQLNA